MAESQHTTKRQRDSEGALVDIHDDKRYKSSSNQVVSCPNKLEQEEHPHHQQLEGEELSALVQQELSDPLLLLSGPSPNEESAPYHQTPATLVASPSSTSAGEADDKEKVIRHLLEASDDELGLPNRMDFNGDTGFDDVGHQNLRMRLWELEDEAANYYTLLQAQLFMY